ncbi:MAG: hypothetical protein COB02_12845 [Candidatus Cloacimonadota bacterium]|nr:MAG: hypothetical protein COB02_12845 [Candidatus Cloacimonadota bacterium]
MKLIILIIALICGYFFVVHNQKGIPQKSETKVNIKIKDCNHGLSFDTCAFCNPSLIESLGFCGGHGVPEAFCTRCDSSIIVAFKSIGDWCDEHKLPESQCKACKSPKKNTNKKIGLKLPPTKKPLFRSQKSPSLSCKNEGSLIRFTNEQVSKDIGLEFTKIVRVIDSKFIACNAQVNFNKNKLINIKSKTKGTLIKVNYQVGQQVKKDDVLAQIQSNELSLAKSQYFQALSLVKLWKKNHQSEKALQTDGATSSREVLQAQNKLMESKITLANSLQNLKNLGLNEKQILELKANQNLSSTLNVISPFDGTIIKKNVVIGDLITSSYNLFTIVDTSIMWVDLDILPKNISDLKINQKVKIIIPELKPLAFSGKVSWIDSSINKKNHTLKARVKIRNSNKVLKSGMFGKATINVYQNIDTLLVHKKAVQWDGCCNIIFVKKSPSSFEVKKVTLQSSGLYKDYYMAQGNLLENQEIVTTGSFILKTEILKGSIGAGCCESDLGK